MRKRLWDSYLMKKGSSGKDHMQHNPSVQIKSKSFETSIGIGKEIGCLS